MSIFTKEQLELLPVCGYTASESDNVQLKVSIGSKTNWLISGWAEENELFFGYACLNGDKNLAEWGSFSIDEIEGLATEYKLEVSNPNMTFKDAISKYIK